MKTAIMAILLLTCGCGVGQTDKSLLHCGGDIGSCTATTPERAQQPNPVRHKKPMNDAPESKFHSIPFTFRQLVPDTVPDYQAMHSIDLGYLPGAYYQDLHPTDAENGHPGWLLYVGYGMAGGANPEQKACRKDGYAHSMIWGVEYVQKCYGNDVIGVLLPLYGDCSEESHVSYIHPITGEVVPCRSELMFGEPDQSIPIVTHEPVRDVKSCLDGRHLEIYGYFPDGRVGYQSVATPYPARGAFRVPNENHIDKCVKDGTNAFSLETDGRPDSLMWCQQCETISAQPVAPPSSSSTNPELQHACAVEPSLELLNLCLQRKPEDK